MSVLNLRLRALRAVSINTAREAIRSKVFGSLMFFAVLLILSSFLLGEMSLHNERRLTKDTALFGSTLFATAISIYASITMFYTEVERRTIYTILSKPIPRWLFLVGKWLGVQGLMIVVVGFMFGVSAVSLIIQGDFVTTPLIAAFVTLYLQQMILTALAHMFATFAAPLLSGFATAAIFISGNLFSQLDTIQKLLAERENPLQHVISAVQVVLPNLESLNLSYELAYNLPIPASYMLEAPVYAISYSGMVLLIAIASFSRLDIS